MLCGRCVFAQRCWTRCNNNKEKDAACAHPICGNGVLFEGLEEGHNVMTCPGAFMLRNEDLLADVRPALRSMQGQDVRSAPDRLLRRADLRRVWREVRGERHYLEWIEGHCKQCLKCHTKTGLSSFFAPPSHDGCYAFPMQKASGHLALCRTVGLWSRVLLVGRSSKKAKS